MEEEIDRINAESEALAEQIEEMRIRVIQSRVDVLEEWLLWS